MRKILNKNKAIEPQIGKYRLYFNEDDEIVEEAMAIKDPESYSYFVDIPINENSQLNQEKRI